MVKTECIKISNQRRTFYISSYGVTEHDLFDLWIKLSRVGYYKIFDKTVVIDSSNVPSDIFFDSLNSFKNRFGF